MQFTTYSTLSHPIFSFSTFSFPTFSTGINVTLLSSILKYSLDLTDLVLGAMVELVGQAGRVVANLFAHGYGDLLTGFLTAAAAATL
jgi:hypothetical protein